MNTVLKNVFPILFLFLAATAFSKSVPGGIAIKQVPCQSKVYFHKNRVLVIKKGRHCLAVIGISLYTKVGIKKLEIKTKNRTTYSSIKVSQKKYPEERLTIKKIQFKRKPSAKVIARLKKEREIMSRALSHWGNKLYTNLKFKLPTKGRFSSPFGLRRIINGKVRSRHRGLDIAARKGTKIKAPAAGQVINTGKYFITGKTVIIDHGKGLLTIYCHLSKIIAKQNQFIRKGQTIGLVGSTGRSTGPHLHWGVSLNKSRIDPLLLLNLKLV